MPKKGKKQGRRDLVPSGGLTIKVQVVGNDSKPQERTANVAPSGASLAEVLEAAGVDPKNKNLFVNDQPAALDRHIGPDDVVQTRPATVRVAERPRSS
jgi:hypothetical protein